MACEHDIPRQPGETILEVKNLSFSYHVHTPVLKQINMHIPAGQICGLFGPNGCGKTTLFRCCMNFLLPSEGEINLLGKPLSSFTPSHLAQHIAYVPQSHQLALSYTVQEMVAMGRSPHIGIIPTLSADDHHIIDHVINKTGLAPLAQRRFSDLSGGQRQLVLVARALAQQAALIFLDEPTSSLDFSNQLLVWEALAPIAKEGVGIFICCHDPNHILWFCDSVVMMNNGSLLGQGDVSSMMTEDNLHTLYGRKIAIKTVEKQSFIYFDRQTA